MLTDDELEQLIDDYVAAARLAHEVGFQFVDVKACHGYLLHEFLSARRGRARFGGDLAGRSRLLLTIIDRIRDELPQLHDRRAAERVRFRAVRDQPRDRAGRWSTTKLLPYECGFGVAADDPLAIDLTEPLELMRTLVAHGVAMINVTCGSPYYNPHIAAAGDLSADRRLSAAGGSAGGRVRGRSIRCGGARQALPRRADGRHRLLVPAGLSCRTWRRRSCAKAGSISSAWGGWCSAYPELPADTLAGRPHRAASASAARSATARRRRATGSISGCYPLDPYYKALPEREQLLEIKQRWLS